MKRFFSKPYRWAAVYSILLSAAFSYALLETFVIPRADEEAAPRTVPEISTDEALSSMAEVPSAAQSPDPVITGTSYQDENIRISIETARKYETDIYLADVQITDPAYFQTAFAQNTYGRNIRETTSAIAQACGALFAVNGDYYGFRDDGFVLRNGILYRSASRSAENEESLVVDRSGNFSIIQENSAQAETLAEQGAWQIFSFGPALVENGEVLVTESDEVAQSMRSNPRTAVGQLGPLHYLFIVSDGRTDKSSGLALAELAQEFAGRGCTTAYNLDGGGSSTMVFLGEVVNHPANGRRSKERAVSDIVWIGY